MNKVRRNRIQGIIEKLGEIRDDISSIRDDEDMAYGNLPEGIQDSEVGERMEDAVSQMDDACDGIDEVIESLNNAI